VYPMGISPTALPFIYSTGRCVCAEGTRNSAIVLEICS
jgi:hypothetical protein